MQSITRHSLCWRHSSIVETEPKTELSRAGRCHASQHTGTRDSGIHMCSRVAWTEVCCYRPKTREHFIFLWKNIQKSLPCTCACKIGRFISFLPCTYMCVLKLDIFPVCRVRRRRTVHVRAKLVDLLMFQKVKSKFKCPNWSFWTWRGPARIIWIEE